MLRDFFEGIAVRVTDLETGEEIEYRTMAKAGAKFGLSSAKISAITLTKKKVYTSKKLNNKQFKIERI